MATPLFPATVLPPSQQGYKVKKPKKFIQSRLYGGETRTRQDLIGGCYTVDCRWECTPKQYTTVSGFLRDRLQGATRIFRIPLLIDVPKLVNYRARLLGEPEELTSNQGLLHTISATLEVLPNPMVSFDLRCQRVSDERVIAANNADFTPIIFGQFPLTRSVLLTGCEGTVNGTFMNLDGTYTILSKPSNDIIVLNNAASINPAWTTLAGTISKILLPDENAGACILLPE